MCKALREALNASGINHNFSDCDRDSQNCDALEALTRTTQYPMILISDLENNLLEVVFLAKDYSQLKESVSYKDGIMLIANHSLDGLLRYTVNRLNLNI
jgi:hypothetical protein